MMSDTTDFTTFFSGGGASSTTNNNTNTTTSTTSLLASLQNPTIGGNTTSERRNSGDFLGGGGGSTTSPLSSTAAAKRQDPLLPYGGEKFIHQFSSGAMHLRSAADSASAATTSTPNNNTGGFTGGGSLGRERDSPPASATHSFHTTASTSFTPTQRDPPSSFPSGPSTAIGGINRLPRTHSGGALTSGLSSGTGSMHQPHLNQYQQQQQQQGYHHLPLPASSSSMMGARYASDVPMFSEPATVPATLAQQQYGGHHHQQPSPQYGQHHHYGGGGGHHHHNSQYHHHGGGGGHHQYSGMSSLTASSSAGSGGGLGSANGMLPPPPSSHHPHHHHNNQHHQHQNNNNNNFRRYDNSAAVENEDVAGVVRVDYDDLNKLEMEHLGKCTVSDIRAEGHVENESYHSEVQRETIVTGNAYLHSTKNFHKIQRIMVGQLWMDFVRDPHSVGRLMAFIANEPVTIFGMIPNDALKLGQNRTVPTMVGFWLSIDKVDHPEGLLDLQRASILFSKKGILAAFTPDEHRRLLEIADRRRSQGNTGLPESPMTLEAAKNPPKRQSSDGKEVDVFRYYPPKDHKWPQTRGGFHPFVTRWEMSLKEDEGRFAPEKSFALSGTEMGKLKPWAKRVVSKLKMGKLHDSDEEIEPHEMDEDDN